MARILVLGGTRFVGPHVIHGLVRRGDDVCVFHRGESEPDLPARVRHVHGSFGSFLECVDELRDFAPNVVIDTVPFHDKGGHGVLHFAGVAQQAIVITSGDVYRAFARLLGSEPGPPDPVPLTERSPLRDKPSPDLGEEIDFDNVKVEQAVASGTLPTTVLRAPVIFGPNDRLHRLYHYVKRMDDERPAILLDARLATWRWSRGYVENVAQAVVLAAGSSTAAGRTYNVAPVQTLTESEWVAAIGQAHGWRGEVIAAPSDVLPEHLRFPFNTDQHIVLDSSRIREELSYAERVPLRDALARTIEWERTNPPPAAPAAFDYNAEDEILAHLRSTRS